MTTRTQPRPAAPGPVRLTPTGRDTWTAVDGRFTITRYRAGRGATLDEREWAANGALDIVDTKRAGILGDVGANAARVYDRVDAESLIARVLKIEHRDALARWTARQTRVGV